MESGKYTCKDQHVPKPATGKTPVRNLRIADETWLPALAKAEAEDRPLTSVIEKALREYVGAPVGAPREFTLANWPEAEHWARERPRALAELGDSLNGTVAPLGQEWLTVAAWLASTRHPSDVTQQKRVLTGHILSRVMSSDEWKDAFRDSRHLSGTVQKVLEERLPLDD